MSNLQVTYYVTRTEAAIKRDKGLPPETQRAMLETLNDAQDMGLLEGAAQAAVQPYADLIRLIVNHGEQHEFLPLPDPWQAILARARTLHLTGGARLPNA